MVLIAMLKKDMRIKDFKKVIGGKLKDSLCKEWENQVQPDSNIFKNDVDNLIKNIKSKLYINIEWPK